MVWWGAELPELASRTGPVTSLSLATGHRKVPILEQFPPEPITEVTATCLMTTVELTLSSCESRW